MDPLQTIPAEISNDEKTNAYLVSQQVQAYNQRVTGSEKVVLKTDPSIMAAMTNPASILSSE